MVEIKWKNKTAQKYSGFYQQVSEAQTNIVGDPPTPRLRSFDQSLDFTVKFLFLFLVNKPMQPTNH